MPRIVPSQVIDFIDQVFSWASKQSEGQSERIKLDQQYSDRLRALLDLCGGIPEELLTLNRNQYNEYVCCLAAIRNAIEYWNSRGDVDPLDRVPGLPDLNPVTLIRGVLSSCPDENPPETTTELLFFSDTGLRDQLRQDIATTNTSLANGEWKAATVLAGSTVEALLLWGIQQHPNDLPGVVDRLFKSKTLTKKPERNPEKWHLTEYIEVARELNLITEETAQQARLAKDFRNLIHPGRTQRLGQKCNRGTALSAVSAIEHVVTDFKKTFA